jgi:hypothetical protein
MADQEQQWHVETVSAEPPADPKPIELRASWVGREIRSDQLDLVRRSASRAAGGTLASTGRRRTSGVNPLSPRHNCRPATADLKQRRR